MSILTPASTSDFLGTGRRKEAVARVRLKPGSGQITVNARPIKDYLQTDMLVNAATLPLKIVDKQNELDVRILAHGGGLSGQADAIKLGIARALQKMDPLLRPPLKKEGQLTRDSRVKERKKPGQPGARKRFQFSKR
jgi:small subunit ribosomal protein S9